jgi:O-antigen/teichoic acid export membrane protein
MSILRSRLARSLSGVFSVRFFGLGTASVVSIILARLMGPTEFGLYSFGVEMVFFIGTPLAVGLSRFLTREIPILTHDEDRGRLLGIVRWSRLLVLALGASVCFLVALALRIIGLEEQKAAILLFSLPLVMLYGLEEVQTGTLRGLKRVVVSQLPEMVFRKIVVVVGAALFVLLSGRTLTSRIGLMLFGMGLAVGAVFSALWYSRNVRSFRRETTPVVESKKWFSALLPFFLLGSIGPVNAKLSTILVGFLRPVEDVGLLKIAIQWSTMISFSLRAVNMTIGPRISELIHSDRRDELQAILRKTVRWVFLIGCAATAFFIFLGRPFLSVLYGPEYLGAYVPLAILSVGQLINISAGSVATVLSMAGFPQEVVKGQAASAVVSALAILLLMPPLGITGAAIASAVGLLVWNAVLLRLLKKRVGVRSSIF